MKDGELAMSIWSICQRFAAWIASQPLCDVGHERVSIRLTPSAMSVAQGCHSEIAFMWPPAY